MNEQTLNLRDIHLPEAVSWWPLAPGWWILMIGFIVILAIYFIAKKIYQSRQLRRDITAELDQIKSRFNETQNKSQLAKSLSILLRRASISYNTSSRSAGLTGEHWLSWLDASQKKPSADNCFLSDTGKVLLNAPYLPEESALDFDADKLIHLCQSWLLTSHSTAHNKPVSPS